MSFLKRLVRNTSLRPDRKWPRRRSRGKRVSREDLMSREVRGIRRRFPDLVDILDGKEFPLEKEHALLFELIARRRPQAHEAALRCSLKDIGTVAAMREIAESDLREGIPYSSNVKLFADIWERALPEIRAHEEAYGAAVFTQNWPNVSRGRALVYYFENNPPAGNIMHIAPEKEAEAHFRATRHKATYKTLGLGTKTDLSEDITEMNVDSESFDLIICHRVLEHIFDEEAALSELYRVLRPGGHLNISVPQSMHLSKTLDWCIPDQSHHRHYRHYGSDFPVHLEKAGFQVECEDWLIKLPESRIRKASTFPFLMFNAYKN